MRTLHIVMPMAGRGSRFAKAGYTTPKPLIKVDGMPMFLKALSSLDDIDTKKRFTCIIRQEHIDEYGIDALLKEALPEINLVITDEEPTGAARDAYRAKEYLQPDEGVIVADCDIWFGGKDYFNLVRDSLSDKNTIDGALLTFEASEPRYSFVETDDTGRVMRTAEKVAISSQAIGGAYYFAKASTFLESCDRLFELPLNESRPEYYVSYLYNVMIENGSNVQAVNGECISFGTPEELTEYFKHNPQPKP